MDLRGSTRAERRGCFEGDGQLEAPEQPKAFAVKKTDRLEVAGNGSNVDVPDAEAPGLADRLLGENGTYAEAAVTGVYDDRLQLRLLIVNEQAAEPDNLIAALCDPDPAELRMLEVRIELNAWIGPTECRIVVDLAVALSEPAPELAASL
jgi:hypothetical protein